MFETNQYSKVINSSNKSFGLVFTIFFFIIISYFIFFNPLLSKIFYFIPICMGLISILKPEYLDKPNKYWLKFGMIIGLILSPVILSMIYICVLLPTSILLKILKKDVLNKKIKKNERSFWIDKIDENDFKNQF